MPPLAALNLKLFQQPLLPAAGTIDLAPFLVMVALLAAGVACMQTRWQRQRRRRVVQIASAAAFVFGLHPCACMIRDLIRGAMVINYDNLLAFQYLMLIVPVAAFTMMWGRAFCGWVCPIGFVQEMATKLTDWMRRAPNQNRMRMLRFGLAATLLLATVIIYAFVRTETFPILQGLGAGYLILLSVLIMLSVSDRRWEVRLRQVRYGALAFFLVTTVVGIYQNAAFCVLFDQVLDYPTVMLFVGVMFASLVLSQAWCRFLCPEGALLGLLTRLSGWRIRFDQGACSNCNTCNTVCPVEAIEQGQVDERSCLYCCKCADHCSTGAIEMTGEKESPRLACDTT